MIKTDQYEKELVTDPKVKESKEKLKGHIFKDNQYWLAVRSVFTRSYAMFFHIGGARSNWLSVSGSGTFVMINGQSAETIANEFLRPVVYLDGSMIEKVSAGQWKIKD